MADKNARLILFLLVLNLTLILYGHEMSVKFRIDTARAVAQETPVYRLPPKASEAASVEESLGGELFEKASNPLSDKLPEADPLGGANPIDSLYKNPFE